MPLLGPMVVVAEKPAAELLDILGKAGAFPIVEANWAEAPRALSEIQPAALMLADTTPAPDARLVRAVVKHIETRGGPIMPVLARVQNGNVVAIPSALPVPHDEPAPRLIARLSSALRVRSLHATVLRRSAAEGAAAAMPLPSSLLDHATVLCVGRGRFYPALTTAIGEHVGLVGAFNVETAARYLAARDIDGVAIGDGLAPRVVEALLTVLAEDARFRDLPVGLLGNVEVDDPRLPNLVRVAEPALMAERLLPLVRLQAIESHLKRVLRSLETDGLLDPDTGLLARDAFWHDLDQAVQEAADSGSALSVARFSFDDVPDRRVSIDAARLLSRQVRDIDFACHEADGSILAVFSGTDLRTAHVAARRIANVLKQSMLSSCNERDGFRPTVTLATLKATDNLSTLVARVGSYPKVAGRKAEV